MTDAETLEAIVATEVERLHRMTHLGDHGTAGPDEHPLPTSTIAPSDLFPGGFWTGARRVDPHPARVGGVISPCCVVDHTTDMHPDDWDALLNGWRTRGGDGACAHFVVGRTEAHGVAQFVSIGRNGNHAGGAGHGVFRDTSGHDWHPNLLAIGIEFHCAGGMLRLINNEWRFVEDGKIHGAPIPASEVEADPARPGRGWHTLTDYQKMIRDWLHQDLDKAMRTMPLGLRAVSTGDAVPEWGVPRWTRFVGHVSLDPTHRADPWPNGMRVLR